MEKKPTPLALMSRAIPDRELPLNQLESIKTLSSLDLTLKGSSIKYPSPPTLNSSS
jgi:hypothetical protein